MPDLVSILPIHPRSLSEPPASEAAASLAASCRRTGKQWWTRCEQSNYLETGKYAETIDFLTRLSRVWPRLRVEHFGFSARQSPLLAAILSAPASNGRAPVIWVQSAIHGGEVAGKDATLLLLRDLTVGGMYSHWLSACTLVFLPVLNPDGHDMFSEYNRFNQNGPRESGWRANAQRLDLNRDFMKASSPEIRAWHSLFNSLLPDCVIDNHTSDGIDHQYDAMFKWPIPPFLPDPLIGWVQDRLVPGIFSGMQRDGHVPGPYFEIEDEEQIGCGLTAEVRPPRFGWTYVACRNRVPLLVESHSLKRYKTQVWAHYDAMYHAIEAVVGDPDSLVHAIGESDSRARNAARVFLDGRVRPDARSGFVFKGLRSRKESCAISGASRTLYGSEPVDRQTTLQETIEETLGIAMPRGYIVPAEWAEVIELLRVHGVGTSQLTGSLEDEVEQYVLSEAHWDAVPSEGRLRLDARAAARRVRVAIPAGSFFVVADQSRARVIAHLLEPDAPDSLLRWGCFNSIFERKEYASDFLLPRLAAQMLEGRAELKAEFSHRLDTEPRFAGDPAARLDFFYRQSPYSESGFCIYPILRLV